MEHWTGLGAHADTYDGLLCDAWGVIHNGIRLFDGVADALVNFRENCGPVVILTNAPRLHDVIPPQLDKLGLPRDAWNAVVTSGDATADAIRQQTGKPAFRLGPDRDETLFSAFDIDFVPMAEAAYILCTGPFDDETETPEDYRGLFEEALARNVPMICANPDIVVHRGDKEIYCGGALARLYEQMGGDITMSGKPYPPVYDLCRQRLQEISGKVPKNLLAIGDGPATDILGANRQNIDAVFVAGGIYRKAVLEDRRLDPQKADEVLAGHGAHAKAVMEKLVW